MVRCQTLLQGAGEAMYMNLLDRQLLVAAKIIRRTFPIALEHGIHSVSRPLKNGGCGHRF